ncbi:hypothetical protein R1flu_000505 [Riccia fluitans]|uniref:BTB domain-containing protein n=1 Tax=Riccia fluitans TaxID=41844 RepID=A0ABD1Y139_9MARC
MKLDTSILDYEEEIGDLSRGGYDRASGLGNKSSSLVDDLRGMVNNPDFSDVSFVCSDGVQVYASRMFLGARSAVFRQMVSCGMSEMRSNVVPLPSVGSSVLIHVLRFLYAGEIEFYHTGIDTPSHHSSGLNSSVPPGHDWKLMIEVLIAARFFLLDSLVKVTLRRMWACSSERVHGMSSENFMNSVADGLSTLAIVIGSPR